MSSRFGHQLPVLPFKSDGCSGGLSKYWVKLVRRYKWFKWLMGDKPPIHRSCYLHDIEYHWGAGPAATWLENFLQRFGADLRFGWSCLVNNGILRLVEVVMIDHLGRFASWKGRLRHAWDGVVSMALAVPVFIAVRFGGGSYWPTAHRWGFGRAK